MSNLTSISNELADLAVAGSGFVVQVGAAADSRRAVRTGSVSGVVYAPDIVLTMARAIGREDGLRVTPPGGTGAGVDADLAGLDPATGIAVLRTRSALDLKGPAIADGEPRVGQIVLALARSWSNALTASAGIVAVVGGPLRTGRRREIARVIRITAPMHEGFAGGAVLDAAGRLAGLGTGAEIRGFGLAIPAAIAWTAASQVLTEGTPRRGFIGVAVQPVELPPAQRQSGHERGLLVIAVTAGGPAETAGLLVGDVLLEVDGRATRTPDDLLDVLADRPAGRTVGARILRGGVARDVQITVADRKRG